MNSERRRIVRAIENLSLHQSEKCRRKVFKQFNAMRMSSEGTKKTNNNKRTKLRTEDAKNVDSLETISIQRDTSQTPTPRAQVEARTDGRTTAIENLL